MNNGERSKRSFQARTGNFIKSKESIKAEELSRIDLWQRKGKRESC